MELQYLCVMYFKTSGRINPATQQYDSYYRLVESYRNAEGRVCHRTILNVGFLNAELTIDQVNLISRTLTDKYQHKVSLFPINDPLVARWVEDLWARIVADNRLDLTLYDPKSRMIDADTLTHRNVREIGTEWICYNTWHQLGLNEVLTANGFNEMEIQLAQSQVISRAVYPASELATARWSLENSAVMALTGYDPEKMNKDRLYKSALKLHSIKEKLDVHLSARTNELFDIQDKIILYDLTNTYFEGEKRNSKLAKFGLSKEKRSDCKILVLALVINIYGFIKHSSVHEGNFSDSKGMDEVIGSLNKVMGGDKKPVVVMDAGIATKENLQTLRDKGYHYLCVSRVKLKNYIADTGRTPILLKTKSGKNVTLTKVVKGEDTDYCMEVQSEMKAIKERGMKAQFEQRFEEELTKIKASLTKKGGVKQVDKVNQRIGRAKQKYPSVQGKYIISLQQNARNTLVEDMNWHIDVSKNTTANEGLGRYFLRTSMDMKDETLVWDVYNTIREIENTFRALKTDLDLRPIYHKKDDSTVAHLYLGLLAYWLVNTIRCQLKAKGINTCWKEIVRIGSTQKVITTVGYNKAEQEISVKKCSLPEQKLKQLFDTLGIKQRPFTKIKSVVHKQKLRKPDSLVYARIPSG